MTGFRQSKRLSALVAVAAFLASSAMPAGAQVKGVGGPGSGQGLGFFPGPNGGKPAEEAKPQAPADEKAYTSAVSRFPDGKGKVDPWKNAR
jgi:hypothetical protein